MKHILFSLLILLLVGAGASGSVDAPGSGPIRVDVAPSDRVKVTSDYWRMEFDLRNGGVLDSIVFPHGSGSNLLVQPLRTYVDGWSDANAAEVEFRQEREGGVVRLEFSGKLAGAGRVAGPVEFRTTWTLSGFVVRADHQLKFPEEMSVATVGIGSTAVRTEMDEYGVRPGHPDDPHPRKMARAVFGKALEAGQVLLREHHAAQYLLLFDRGREGFDVTTASDLATWESGLTGRGGVGRFEARVRADGRSIELLREPVHVPHPLPVAKGEHTFSYYLGLPRIVERSPRKWRHLSFGNHPWPSDEGIAQWAEVGVNVVRLHNDFADDGNFWHDGAWPPYDEAGMAELRRVIATCHRHGIQVAPYFSIHEFHPKAQGYAEHEEEWKRSTDQAGTVYHNSVRKGEFGAQMRPMSGWLDRRKQDIEKAYREFGFDGIYYDWLINLACDNKNHNARLHLGSDHMIDLLAWSRRLIAGKGPLILHLYGKMPSIAFENFADLVVNMEEVSGAAEMMEMSEIPLVTVLAESIERSPCPSYRPDRRRERNQNSIAHLAVLGMFPWSGGTGGPTYEETMKLFRAFQPYQLERYRFRDALSGAVRTSWGDVYGALYDSAEDALVVISNTGSKSARKVVWTVSPEALTLDAKQLRVKDQKTGRVEVIGLSGLSDGTLVTALEGYEYRLFEVRPVH